MKYIKTYENLITQKNESGKMWNYFHNRLKELFKIIGYSYSYYPDMGGNPLRLNINLIGIAGSLSYCYIQNLIKEYEDVELIKKYKNPKNKIYPRREDDLQVFNILKYVKRLETSDLSTNIKGNLEKDGITEIYKNYIEEIIKNISDLNKIRPQQGLSTYINKLIFLQVDYLNENKDNYLNDIIINDNIVKEAATCDAQTFEYMKNNVPLLFNKVKQLIGDEEINNAIQMKKDGFTD